MADELFQRGHFAQQHKKQLVRHWEWRQLSQNYSEIYRRKKLNETILGYIYTEVTQAIFTYFIIAIAEIT